MRFELQLAAEQRLRLDYRRFGADTVASPTARREVGGQLLSCCTLQALCCAKLGAATPRVFGNLVLTCRNGVLGNQS